LGTDAYRFGGQRIGPNPPVRTDLVEVAVWEEVCRLLEHPQRLEQEYRRRQHAPRRGSQWETPERLRAQSKKLRQGIARLIDSYAEGVIGKEECEPRVTRMTQKVTSLEARLQQLADDATQQQDLRLIISQLEDFVAKVRGGLATADWLTRREIIRALVRRVEIDQQHVSVVFRVPPMSTNSDPDSGILPDCRRGELPVAGQHRRAPVRAQRYCGVEATMNGWAFMSSLWRSPWSSPRRMVSFQRTARPVRRTPTRKKQACGRGPEGEAG